MTFTTQLTIDDYKDFLRMLGSRPGERAGFVRRVGSRRVGSRRVRSPSMGREGEPWEFGTGAAHPARG